MLGASAREALCAGRLSGFIGAHPATTAAAAVLPMVRRNVRRAGSEGPACSWSSIPFPFRRNDSFLNDLRLKLSIDTLVSQAERVTSISYFPNTLESRFPKIERLDLVINERAERQVINVSQKRITFCGVHSCRVASASLPRQPAAHPFLHRGGQAGPIVSIAALAERFGLRRVRVNDRSQFAQPDASRHRHTDFADHLAGMARNDGCSEDFIVPFPDVDFHETIFLTVQNRAVHLPELPHVGVHFD